MCKSAINEKKYVTLQSPFCVKRSVCFCSKYIKNKREKTE